jgi:hypothetical protein
VVDRKIRGKTMKLIYLPGIYYFVTAINVGFQKRFGGL